MPVPILETPLGREWYEEGRHNGWKEGWKEGWREGWHEGQREAVLRLTALMLRQRFGDDRRCADIAAGLADLPDVERLARVAAAASLDELET